MADWSKPLREKRIFQNPTRTWPKGFGDVIKWMVFEKKTLWPDWIEISPKPQIFSQVSTGEINCVMINHATVLLQTSQGNLLTDPVFSDRTSPFKWAGPKRKKRAGLEITELPPIQAVLISHNHYDHMDMASLKELWKKFDPVFVMPLENKHLLQAAGIQSEKMIELDWWQSHDITGELKVTVTPAQHWSSRSATDRNRSLWGGFWIECDHQKIFFAGDTGYADHFQVLKEKLGAPDLSLLPIGAYEPRWFMRDQHMNPEDAVLAHLDLQSRLSVAIHWGTWQLTNEGHLDPVASLKEALSKLNVSPDKFRALENGENIALRSGTVLSALDTQ